MFEVGQRYEIKMIIDGEETTMWRTVEKYEHPLLKFADIHPPKISLKFSPGPGPADRELPDSPPIPGETINVSSPNFISATPRRAE